MACGCGQNNITTATVQEAQAAADQRRAATKDLTRAERTSQQSAISNAGGSQQ